MFLKCFGDTSSSKRPYPTVIEELCEQFSLTDLRKSTHNFDDKKCLIGKGGFGKVYKGCLQRNDGSYYTVAIRQFHVLELELDGVQLFMNEVELLCQLRHPNIISLIGFCNHKKDKFIVLEYMSNRSLHQHLQYGNLSWKKRLEICIGAARGLHYLHAGAKRTIIHRNIKPSNILLDDNMEPKLGDFALSLKGARFMAKPKPIRVDHVAGTLGYLAAEQFTDLTVTDKIDVYSFGMVLLEVVCGMKYEKMLAETESFEDPVEKKIDLKIKGKIAPECWQVFIELAQRCVKNDPDERPAMGEVEVELEHALSLQEQADITNTSSDYTLLSTTIIELVRKLETNADTDEGVELETSTEDSDTEEM